jgi:hypothetical protein
MTKRKKTAFILLLVAALGLLVPVGWNYHLRHELRKYCAPLIARGEFLSTTQAWPKPLTGDPRLAAAFLSAANNLIRGPVLSTNQVPLTRAVHHGRAMAGSLRPHIHNSLSSTTTNTWADLADELAANAQALETIRKCTRAPGLDFNLDYRSFSGLNYQHLAKLKATAQTLWMAVALALHNKDLESARTNLVTLLALGRIAHQDRLLIAELVQIAITQIAAGATWEALQTPGWTDAQLKHLQETWGRVEFLGPVRNTLMMERAMSSQTMEDYRLSPQKFAAALDPMSAIVGTTGGGPSGASLAEVLEQVPEAIKAKAAHTLWRYFWSYEDELRCLEIFAVHLEALNPTNRAWKTAELEIDRRLNAVGIKTSSTDAEEFDFLTPKVGHVRTFFSDAMLQTKNYVRKAYTAETVRELVTTAIAIKRFQLNHDGLPTSLARLVPDFLPSEPVDYMDGQPLRYRLEPDLTFTLYSIGPDGIDGGGKAPAATPDRPPGWMQSPDWVWPTLASPKEIEEFEARQAEKNNKKAVRRRPNPKPASTNTVQQPTAPAP